MKIGYINPAVQRGSLCVQRSAIDAEDVGRKFEERPYFSTLVRPALAAALSVLQRGDTLVAWKIDCLGTSLGDVVGVLEDLRKRGISFKSTLDNLELLGGDDNPFAPVIEALYRCSTSQPTDLKGTATQSPRRSGGTSKIGRPLSLNSDQIAKARGLVQSGVSASSVAKSLKVSRSTLYRFLGPIQT